VEYHFADSDELIIPTSQYPNGIYFARTANGQTKRFVIAH